MSTRRAEQIIAQVRRQSKNEDYSATSGISQEEILYYLNEGLADLQTAIVHAHDRAFIAEGFLNTVANQEAYDLPANMLDHGGLLTVEYSDSGNDQFYYKLEPLHPRERSSRISASPSFYIRRANQVILRPVPSATITNGLRLQYIKRLDKLDIRRGVVSAVTLGSNTITALTLNIATFTSPNGFDQDDYLCIVDKDGNVKMRNVRFDTINTGSGVVTVSSGFTFETGETISVGDYAVIGRNTSTNQLDIDETVERYLIQYSVMKVQQTDSNNDSQEAMQNLLALKQEIVQSYSNMDEDLVAIPETNTDGN
jgi:hypothetical protein